MKIDAFSQLAYLLENFPELATTSEPLWHPLGFVSCIVRIEENEFTTRVHYWPKNQRRCKNPDWPIHTHAYDLSSLVLDGRIRDIQYERIDGAEFSIYSVSYVGQDSSIIRTDQLTSIEPVVDQIRESGDEYKVPIATFHQTLVSIEEEAVTLVVQSNFSNVAPLVLGSDAEKIYPYDRVRFDSIVFWNRVQKAIQKF